MENISFISRQHLTENQSVSEHSHRCWEVFFYNTCSGVSKIGNEEFPFRSNSFAVIPPDCPHNELHCETGSLIYVGFSTDDLRVRPGIYSDTENRLVERLVHLILSVFRTRFSDSDGSDELIGNLLHAMVLLLNRVCNESHIRQPDLLYARRFIDENVNRKIDFTGLAKSMGMTFDLFRRSFKKKYGVSPKNYLIDLRLEKAKKMLEEPDRNCTQVALECGFSSSAQFSTMFREKYGITPQKIRARKEEPRPLCRRDALNSKKAPASGAFCVRKAFVFRRAAAVALFSPPFNILQRRYAAHPLEHCEELRAVPHPDALRNLLHAQIGVNQQIGGMVDPHFGNQLMNRGPRVCAKVLVQLGAAEEKGFCNVLRRNRLAIVLSDVIDDLGQIVRRGRGSDHRLRVGCADGVSEHQTEQQLSVLGGAVAFQKHPAKRFQKRKAILRKRENHRSLRPIRRNTVKHRGQGLRQQGAKEKSNGLRFRVAVMLRGVHTVGRAQCKKRLRQHGNGVVGVENGSGIAERQLRFVVRVHMQRGRHILDRAQQGIEIEVLSVVLKENCHLILRLDKTVFFYIVTHRRRFVNLFYDMQKVLADQNQNYSQNNIKKA